MKNIIIILILCISGQSMAWGQKRSENNSALKYQRSDIQKTALLIKGRKLEKNRFHNIQLFRFHSQRIRPEHQDELSAGNYLKLDARALRRILQERPQDIHFTIPLSGGESVELELTAVEVRQTDFHITTASGRAEQPQADGLFYRGIVKDNPNSWATISIFSDHIQGLIAEKNSNRVLVQIPGDKSSFLFYNDRHLLQVKDWSCGTDDLGRVAKPVEDQRNGDFEFDALATSFCVNVYVESDYQYYLDTGSDIATVAIYMLSHFHEVATAYYNESINIELSELFIWDQADPYAGISDRDDILASFVSNRSTFNGDAAHLISSRSFSGIANGIGGICASEEFLSPHCISSDFSSGDPTTLPSSTVSFTRFAHELGHVLGSYHTHACVWNGNNTQIDDCGNISADNRGDTPEGDDCYNPADTIVNPAGTIMSYCSHRDLLAGFGPQPAALIQNTINSASCLQQNSCHCATSNLLSVTGNIDPGVYETNGVLYASSATVAASQPVILRGGSRVEIVSLETFSGSTFIVEAGGVICDLPEDNSLISPSTPEVAGREETAGIPGVLDLEVYPNPLQDRAAVRLSLYQDETIAIKLINTLGQQMVTVLEEGPLSAGEYSYSLSAAHLPAGVYTLLVRTPKGSGIRQVVISDP